MKQVAIPKEVYRGNATQLFDFLAGQLAEFIKDQEEANDEVRRQRLLSTCALMHALLCALCAACSCTACVLPAVRWLQRTVCAV